VRPVVVLDEAAEDIENAKRFYDSIETSVIEESIRACPIMLVRLMKQESCRGL